MNDTRPMNDTARLVLRADATGSTGAVTPERAGWRFSGLDVRSLVAGEPVTWTFDGDEAVVVPLSGSLTLGVRHEDGSAELELAGRRTPFDGPADVAYLPRGSVATAVAPDGGRVAVATARAARTLPVQVLRASSARVDLRGAGVCSRRVTSYSIDTDLQVDRLLVCEVVTPGGNWSSYPPHKHDQHADDERELEEIYYFEVAAGAGGGPGVAYHRTYGTADRPVDVLAEVRTGDVALVPHGYHGPCIASPGHDLYYLNVMAGPADDGRWLAVDDPALAWVRGTWEGAQVDRRLLPAAAGPSDQRRTTPERVDEDAREDHA